jgi:hypothetical protein
MQFLRHSRDRGTLFVDSYAGTSRLRDAILVALVGLPPIALVALILLAVAGFGWAAAIGLALVLVALLVPLGIALANRVSARGALAYVVYVVPFGIVFWLGLVRGVALRTRRKPTPSAHAEDTA